ncbi:MAG: alpha/beta hydrolase [Planctomycetes bacterium]|nr:alpha/beta hydrolase [Planctomycetota bacterium]
MLRPAAAAPFAAIVTTVLAAVSAQAPYLVGRRDVAWPNPTGQGSASLAARVLYPSLAAGTGTPILPQAGGWPVIVFLHGFALLGNSYEALGNAWARQGVVVVLGNTAQFDNIGQERDGRAQFAALQAANLATGPFQGAFDLQRTVLAGHSMGGGNVANVLADNPGYRAGFAIAPVPPRAGNGALVAVPIGLVAGAGDTVTPPGSNAAPFYQSLTGYADLKAYCLLDGSANHTNLAGLFVSSGADTAVFERSAAVALGFLQHALGLSAQALDQVLGPPVLTDPRLVSLQQEFAAAQTWIDRAFRVGTTTMASAGFEPGPGGIGAALAALGPPLPTPFGGLRLDPATAFVLGSGLVGAERRLAVPIALPPDPALAGIDIALQAFGWTRAQELLLGSALDGSVVP